MIRRTGRLYWAWVLVMAANGWTAGAAMAGDGTSEAVIVEPYLEVHTGPGRDYPVFYVAEQGETVTLLKRRTDWYKILLANGKEGWARRAEIQRTMVRSGREPGFIDRFYDAVLLDRLEMGWATGTFNGEPSARFHIRYFPGKGIGVEAGAGFVSGRDEGTEIYQGSLVAVPWESRRVSVFAVIGSGWAIVDPESLLIDTERESLPEVHAGVGLRIGIYKQLSVAGEFRNYTFFNSPEETGEFQEYTVGLSFLY